MLGHLTQKITYGVKFGQTFRKKLPLDYKKGNKHTHKNPHALPLQVKNKLMNQKRVNFFKLRQLQRQSLKPFGRLTRTGFKFDKQKLPFYEIPNIDGFELKPYVEFNAPKIEGSLKTHQKNVNQEKIRAISEGKQLPS